MTATWQSVLRRGIFPQLSDAALAALRAGVATDDPALIQGETTTPAALTVVQDWAVEAACVLGYCGWQGEGLTTVAEVAEFFANVCFECDRILDEPAGCRWFLNEYDVWGRDEMRWNLLAEVEAEIARREGVNRDVA